jgi:hypothetical protein
MVIGEVSGRELANLLSSARQALEREVNVVSMPPAEFRDKVGGGNSFVLDVQQGPKIFLVGGEDELRELSNETERGKYDRGGEISETEAGELSAEVSDFKTQVDRWLRGVHPEYS